MTEKEREIYNLIGLRYNGKIRIEWDEDDGEEYLAIVDVVKVFTEENPYDAEVYWKGLKNQLWKEGCEWVRTIPSMPLYDDRWGEERLTEVATASQVYRIVQSISSPKAELLKQWMAELAERRVGEIDDSGFWAYRALLEWCDCLRGNRIPEDYALEPLKELGAKLIALDKMPTAEESHKLFHFLAFTPIQIRTPEPNLFNTIEEEANDQ